MRTRERRRSIVHEFEFDHHLELFFGKVRRADEIFRDWMEALARSPERGYAVQRAPEYAGLPIHTEDGSFLVIYWFDEERAYCIGMRRVPSGIYGETRAGEAERSTTWRREENYGDDGR